MKCPKCGGTVLQRMPRFGFWQLKVLAFFSRYPWRCMRCGKTTYFSQRTDVSSRA